MRFTGVANTLSCSDIEEPYLREKTPGLRRKVVFSVSSYKSVVSRTRESSQPVALAHEIKRTGCLHTVLTPAGLVVALEGSR